MAFPVVGCLARKPYSVMASSHCIQRATLMAYRSKSCGETRAAQPRSASQVQVFSKTSAATSVLPSFWVADSMADGFGMG